MSIYAQATILLLRCRNHLMINRGVRGHNSSEMVFGCESENLFDLFKRQIRAILMSNGLPGFCA
jgi:hypothetical protein